MLGVDSRERLASRVFQGRDPCLSASRPPSRPQLQRLMAREKDCGERKKNIIPGSCLILMCLCLFSGIP